MKCPNCNSEKIRIWISEDDNPDGKGFTCDACGWNWLKDGQYVEVVYEFKKRDSSQR